MSAGHFVSIGDKSVETPSLATHPLCSAEEKGGPKKVNLSVPDVILPLNHGSHTEILFLGLTMQEKIGLVGWCCEPWRHQRRMAGSYQQATNGAPLMAGESNTVSASHNTLMEVMTAFTTLNAYGQVLNGAPSVTSPLRYFVIAC
ncbi:hypothetical protein V6N13_101584 [Hibiscus sabdariffa]